ncbi:MAG: cytidylate kinase family protein, partial [Nitrospinae bacterium]|nr:cytidylate kinase family protein [Nitrospinota bacterium]
MAVVTISRQYGTGGIFIARELADKLNYAFLGRDELVEICKQRGLTLDLEKIEGRAPTILER